MRAHSLDLRQRVVYAYEQGQDSGLHRATRRPLRRRANLRQEDAASAPRDRRPYGAPATGVADSLFARRSSAGFYAGRLSASRTSPFRSCRPISTLVLSGPEAVWTVEGAVDTKSSTSMSSGSCVRPSAGATSWSWTTCERTTPAASKRWLKSAGRESSGCRRTRRTSRHRVNVVKDQGRPAGGKGENAGRAGASFSHRARTRHRRQRLGLVQTLRLSGHIQSQLSII
jgi:hypothetical protein